MSINYRDVLEKRDQFSAYLHDQVVNYVDSDVDPDDVVKLAEALLKDGWVEIDD